MSFRDLIDTSAALALADKLQPTEVSIWERYCRDFSVNFATPLLEVHKLDPLFVMREVNALNLSDFEPEENIERLFEIVGSLSDPDYDHKKEMALKEEIRQIEEREAKRLKNNEPVHESLGKDKRVIAKEESKPKELPKSGGINMGLINKLNNQDREG